MNKFTKGAIATGAGIILLLGGAGTFALWNDEQSVNAGTITSGVLDITGTSGGTWTANGSPVASIGSYLIVPGDVLVYTKTLTVTATGDNLAAHLSVDPLSISYVGTEIDDELEISLAATGGTAVTSNSGTPLVLTDDVTTITDSLSSQTITVTVKVVFPSDVPDQVAQNQSANLSALQLLLQQF